ncbi:MAG: hypothetical protein JW882_02090 [Deltaproteobacteria bacterium]|nr:hypothetical protein [Deltaproteobacteria bacterium]
MKIAHCGIRIAVWGAVFNGESLGSRIIAQGACQAGGYLLRSFHLGPSL